MSYDIVFVYINVINGYITGAEYQLNSAYTRSYLNKYGIKTVQYTNKNPGSHWEIINDLNMSCASKFAFFINEYNYYISKLIINNLKELDKDLVIYAFGPVIRYIYEELSKDISIDFYLFNEEFRAIQELLTADGNYSIVNNIAYKCEDKLYKTEEVKTEYSLDDLGLIYSENVVPPEEARGIGMLSSMGCYGNCSFCSYYSKNGFKTHSIESVISELDYLSFYIGRNITPISFFDDCFSVSIERSIELCERIKSKHYNFKFWCCTRADLLNKQLIDLMADCNFKNIVIGLETASIDVFSKLGKVKANFPAEDYLVNLHNIYQYAVKKGINPLLSVNFGLPFEQLSDATKTIQFLKDNSATDNVSVCFMTSFPGSNVFENSDFYGISKEPSPTVLPYRTFYERYNMETVYNHLIDSGILKGEILENISHDRRYKNDYVGYFSGVFDQGDLSGKIKFIEVKDNIDRRAFDFIDRNTDLNGTVIRESENIKLNKKALFADDRKRLKLSFAEYDETLAQANKYNMYFPKMAFIKKGSHTLIQPDDVYRKRFMEFKINTLKNLDDLRKLTKRVEHFLNTDSLTEVDLENGIVVNSCAFTGGCNICSLRRVMISDGKVYTCSDQIEIGAVDDSYYGLLSNIATMIDEKDVRRECNNCEASKACPKCVMPPDFLSEKEYCNVIINNPYLGLYIHIVNFLHYNLDKYDKFNPSVYSAKKYNMLHANRLNSLPRFSSEVVFIDTDNMRILYKYDSNKIMVCNNREKRIILYLLGLMEGSKDELLEFDKVVYRIKVNGFFDT